MVPASGIWLEVIFGTNPSSWGRSRSGGSGALTSQYRACCGWCLRYGACCPHPTFGAHTRGMVPPQSCPSQWEDSTPTESFVTELLRCQVQRQLPAWSAHHCNATWLVVTTIDNNSALPLSQPQSKTWPELPCFIPETPYFMKKDPGAQAGQMIFPNLPGSAERGFKRRPGTLEPCVFPMTTSFSILFCCWKFRQRQKSMILGKTVDW